MRNRNSQQLFSSFSPKDLEYPIALDENIKFKDQFELQDLISKVDIDLELDHMLDAFNFHDKPWLKFYDQLMISQRQHIRSTNQITREALFSPEQDIFQLQEKDFLKEAGIGELPIINSKVQISFDNYSRINKNVDLLSFRKKVREEQIKETIPERDVSNDSDQPQNKMMSKKRLSSVFDQDINTSEFENAKLVINLAQKYDRIKHLEQNHTKDRIFGRTITHYDSTITIEKLQKELIKEKSKVFSDISKQTLRKLKQQQQNIEHRNKQNYGSNLFTPILQQNNQSKYLTIDLQKAHKKIGDNSVKHTERETLQTLNKSNLNQKSDIQLKSKSEFQITQITQKKNSMVSVNVENQEVKQIQMNLKLAINEQRKEIKNCRDVSRRTTARDVFGGPQINILNKSANKWNGNSRNMQNERSRTNVNKKRRPAETGVGTIASTDPSQIFGSITHDRNTIVTPTLAMGINEQDSGGIQESHNVVNSFFVTTARNDYEDSVTGQAKYVSSINTDIISHCATPNMKYDETERVTDDSMSKIEKGIPKILAASSIKSTNMYTQQSTPVHAAGFTLTNYKRKPVLKPLRHNSNKKFVTERFARENFPRNLQTMLNNMSQNSLQAQSDQVRILEQPYGNFGHNTSEIQQESSMMTVKKDFPTQNSQKIRTRSKNSFGSFTDVFKNHNSGILGHFNSGSGTIQESSLPFITHEDGDNYIYYHQVEAFQNYLEQIFQMKRSQMALTQQGLTMGSTQLNHNNTEDIKKIKAKQKMDKIKEFSQKLRIQQKEQRRHKTVQPIRDTSTKFIKNPINANMDPVMDMPSPLRSLRLNQASKGSIEEHLSTNQSFGENSPETQFQNQFEFQKLSIINSNLGIGSQNENPFKPKQSMIEFDRAATMTVEATKSGLSRRSQPSQKKESQMPQNQILATSSERIMTISQERITPKTFQKSIANKNIKEIKKQFVDYQQKVRRKKFNN